MIDNPIYGGAYAYGKSRVATGYDAAADVIRPRSRRKARAEWLALIPGVHEGYVSWERSEAIRKMVSDNMPTGRHHGAPKHGDALLAGLVRCRRCGRKLTVRYTGAKHNIPRYSCWRGSLDHGEPRCIAFGGLRVDDAIEEALLRVVEPGAIAAAVEAEAHAASRRDQVREALVRDLEAARYSADRAFRQYDAIDPQKDVDGLHPQNAGLLMVGCPGLRACTPSGCMRLIAEAGCNPDGKQALVHRSQKEGSAANPIGEGRTIQIDALPSINLSLAVERQVVSVF